MRLQTLFQTQGLWRHLVASGAGPSKGHDITWKFLRLACKNQAYQFEVLPFSSPVGHTEPWAPFEPLEYGLKWHSF
ncbi:unnamed protein product [Merluccius merluccius]